MIILPVGVCLYVSNNSSDRVHARDLGVRPDKQDLASARAKFRALRTGQPERLDSAELTAWLKHSGTAATPIVDSQVRINEDRSIEISGLLVTDRLVPYAEGRGMSGEQAQQLVDQLGSSDRVPLYIRSQGAVANGRLQLSVKAVEVDDIGVPRFMIRDKQNEVERILQQEVERMGIYDLQVAGGEIELQFNKR